jgi:hypothetical protein
VSVNFTKTAPNCTRTITNATCYNGTGTIVASSPNGGNSGVYTVSLNGGSYQSFPQTFSVYAGNNTITVKDTLGCTQSYSTTITQPSAVSISISGTNPSCYGHTNGSITLSGSGGTSPYTYSINGGSTYQAGTSFTGLGAGSYNTVVKDSNNCTASGGAVLTQPSVQSATIYSVVGATSGDNGSLTISSDGGTWNKTYRLYKDSASPYNDYPTDNLVAIYTNVTSGSPSISVTGLACGYYWLHVTDANGCISYTGAYEITCPGLSATINYHVQGLRAGLTINSASGAELLNKIAIGSTAVLTGTITVLASDLPYTVIGSWEGGSGNIVRYVICDDNGGTLIESGAIDNAIGSEEVILSPTPLSVTIRVRGSNVSPGICPT